VIETVWTLAATALRPPPSATRITLLSSLASALGQSVVYGDILRSSHLSQSLRRGGLRRKVKCKLCFTYSGPRPLGSPDETVDSCHNDGEWSSFISDGRRPVMICHTVGLGVTMSASMLHLSSNGCIVFTVWSLALSASGFGAAVVAAALCPLHCSSSEWNAEVGRITAS
jgi:hypothetical protein